MLYLQANISFFASCRYVVIDIVLVVLVAIDTTKAVLIATYRHCPKNSVILLFVGYQQLNFMWHAVNYIDGWKIR